MPAPIDLLYVAYNRLEMTRESFTALMEFTPQECEFMRVNKVFVLDDGSTDGTSEFLQDAIEHEWSGKFDFVFHGKRFGGPVAAMNFYLGNKFGFSENFCKIDNDFIVCPGWFEEVSIQHHLHPEVNIIGFEPMDHGVKKPPHSKRKLEAATHIGGKGFIRTRAFDHCWPKPNGKHGYGGFTEWQTQHEYITKAWITPDLPMFGMDQLPFDPWASLTEEYSRKGWCRRWPVYDASMRGYWDWWVKADRRRKS